MARSRWRSRAGEPVLRLLAASEHTARRVLQIQVWALVPLSVGSILAMGLLSLGRQRTIAVANAVAVVVVLSVGLVLIGAYGGEEPRSPAWSPRQYSSSPSRDSSVQAARCLPSRRFVWRSCSRWRLAWRRCSSHFPSGRRSAAPGAFVVVASPPGGADGGPARAPPSRAGRPGEDQPKSRPATRPRRYAVGAAAMGAVGGRVRDRLPSDRTESLRP